MLTGSNTAQIPAISEKDTTHEFIRVGGEHKFIRADGVEGEIIENPIKTSGRKQMDKSVFDFSDENWNEIGTASLKESSNKEDIDFSSECIENLVNRTFNHCGSSIMCKDGFVIYNNNGFTIVGIRVVEEKKSDDGDTYYEHNFKFFANKLVIPIFALKDLMKFTNGGCYHGLGCSR